MSANLRLVTTIAAMTVLLGGCNEDKLSISKEELGKKFFEEVAFSRDGKQSCATCHDVQHAFIDPRSNVTSLAANFPGAVSLGQDDKSLGDRNTPSAAYNAFVPAFYLDSSGEEALFKGGLFLDGRVADLVEQAKQPFLNAIEMQNTKEAVVATAKAKYRAELQALYGANVFQDVDTTFNAIADSIAEFEKTATFAPFDSKFDRFLQGKAALTEQEQRGLVLFKDENKGNCAACHPVPDKNSSKAESLFTDFSYDNLGVPKNTLARLHNGKAADFVDRGLANNDKVKDDALAGAFRVSSLRNVAVTGPYMHNGVFKDLTTVVHFYNSRDVVGALNPETGQPWAAAEIDSTKNTTELGNLKLSDAEIADIVAFMKTLTDARYEHLLK